MSLNDNNQHNQKQMLFSDEPPHEVYLTRSIRDSETSIDFVQGPAGSRRERVKKTCVWVHENVGYQNKIIFSL